MISVLHVAEVLKAGTSSYMNEVLGDQAARFGAGQIAVLAPRSQLDCLSNLEKLSVFTFEDEASRLTNIRRIQGALKAVLKERRFDVIHIHGTFAGIAVRTLLGWRGRRPRIVYCSHGWAFDRESSAWKNTVIATIERALSHLCDRVICISDHDRNSAQQRKFPANRLVTIKNGIADLSAQPQAEVQWPSGKLRFLFAGRFDRQKGIDIFFDAMRKMGPGYAAVAIGDASVGDHALSEAPGNVVLTGWLPRDTVQAYLRSCDVLVMPSRWEGFGLSALEAMRAARPVVASRVGGLVELIEDGVTGRLVAPNSAEQLAAAMQAMAQDDLAAMGQAARRRYETFFTAERLNREIRALYGELLSQELQ